MRFDPPVMLTTIDNPYNPFTHYPQWEEFDTSRGYQTPSYLARVTTSSEELSDEDQEIAIDNAISEIIQENTLGIYRTITENGDIR